MNNDQCDSRNLDLKLIQSIDLEDNQLNIKQSSNQIKVCLFGEEFKSKLQSLREKVSKSKAQTEKELNEVKTKQQATQFHRYGKFITSTKFSGIVNLIENKQLNSKRVMISKDNPIHLIEFKSRPRINRQLSSSSSYNIYNKIQEVTGYITSRRKIINQMNSIMSRNSNLIEYQSQAKSRSQPNIIKLINDRMPKSTSSSLSLKRNPSFTKEYYQKELDSFSSKLFSRKDNNWSKSVEFFSKRKRLINCLY